MLIDGLGTLNSSIKVTLMVLIGILFLKKDQSR